MNYTDRVQAALAALPPKLAARPRDARGLPVPFVQTIKPDGTPDFTTIFAPRVQECAQRNLCALCGDTLGYYVAFLGGPNAASNRGGQGAYIDPGMHPECADAALKLCPHIAVQNAIRARNAPDANEYGAITTHPALSMDKNDTWVLLIARSFKYTLDRSGFIFLPSRTIRRREFTYDPASHLLREVGA